MLTLKEQRKQAGYTREEVAESLGVELQEYSQLEDHPEQMTIEQAKAVCQFVGFDFDLLVPLEVKLTDMAQQLK